MLREGGGQCLAWVLMLNHLHLLIRTGRRPLRWIMHRLLQRYAVRFNRKYGHAGHVFQNRYKSILCEEDAYLKELIRYIHLNPARTREGVGLERLRRYEWSGHLALVGKTKVTWQAVDPVLELFGNTRSKAREAYVRFVSEGSSAGHQDLYEGGGLIRSAGGESDLMEMLRRGERVRGDQRILGSGEFVAGVLREVEKRDRRRRGVRRGLTPQAVVERAAGRMGVPVRQVYGRDRRASVVKARFLACKWLVEDLGVSVTKAARLLHVTPPAVSYGVRQGRKVEEETGASLPTC